MTPIRQRTFELVSRSRRAIKASEVLDRIGDEHVIASPMRVYRLLDCLTRHVFVRHLKTISAFVWCDWPQDVTDAPFLICDQCESVIALLDPDVNAKIVERASWYGFEADLSTIELLCRSRYCDKKRLRWVDATPSP